MRNSGSLKIELKKVLHYYATFRHPLKLNEIHFNCLTSCSKEEVEESLKQLVEKNDIHNSGNYYSVSDKIEEWIERRKKGETTAQNKLTSAMHYGKFIASFPFVRFIGISGSLSKGYADEASDYDFFIITAHNRLWICRTILHLIKKISFAFGLQHKFCMNYFVDEEHSEIEEKNLYTAIEISSIKAVAGKEQYKKLLQTNKWRFDFLPNGYQPYFDSTCIYDNKNPMQRLFECIIDPMGSWLNNYLMKLTDKKWKKKWQKRNYPQEDYKLAFKTTLHHSKNHPANYQKKMLSKIDKINPVTT